MNGVSANWENDGKCREGGRFRTPGKCRFGTLDQGRFRTRSRNARELLWFLTQALSIAHASVCLTDVQVALLMLRVLIEHTCRMLPANCLSMCMHVPRRVLAMVFDA